MVGALVLALVAPAEASQAELERAAARANAAAAELARAQRRLAELESEVAELEARRADTDGRLQALAGAVRDVAVSRFVQGRAARPLAGEVELDASAAARAEALERIVSAQARDTLDEYRMLAEDLEVQERALTSKQEAAAAALGATRRRAAEVRQELVRLQKLEAERKAREAARRRQAAAAARVRSASRTSFAATGDWMCPVQGARAFTDDWGDPRGGGRRRHQGTDILAARGTPVVAPVSGTVRPASSANGGLSFYLNGSDGIEYFGAHLDSYSGRRGAVRQGDVIGTVGTSGNARGGPPHLHFEMHPGGGAPVNPYPTVRRYC